MSKLLIGFASVLVVAAVGALTWPPVLPVPTRVGGGTGPVTRLSWDLSGDRDVSRVGWPAGSTGEEWRITSPGVLDLDLGVAGRHSMAFHQLWAKRENGRVSGIAVFLPAATVDEGYAQVTAAADAYGVRDQAELHKWHWSKGASVTAPGGRGWAAALLNEPPLYRLFEVRPTFAGPAKPWYVKLMFAFLPVDQEREE